jgi:serine/threonine-protein kinase RsbW
LRVPASAAYIAPVRAFAERVLDAWFPDGIGGDAAGEFLVAVQEAVTNVIRHGYPAGTGELELEIRIDASGEGAEVVLRDWGVPFDPDGVPPPDFEHPRPGGYGLHIIRSFTDRCDFDRDGRTNLVRLARRLRLPVEARVEAE